MTKLTKDKVPAEASSSSSSDSTQPSGGDGLSFANMSIEDAVELMFMLISNDAREDLRSMLGEMDAARRHPSSLRRVADVLRRDVGVLRRSVTKVAPGDVATEAVETRISQLEALAARIETYDDASSGVYSKPTRRSSRRTPATAIVFSRRTIATLVGLIALIVLAGGVAFVLGSQPSSTIGALFSPGAGSFAGASTAIGGSPSPTVASTEALAPTLLPMATRIPAKPTPPPKATPKPKPTPPRTVIAFKVSATSVGGDCKSSLAPFVLTLDNSESSVAVPWSVTFAGSPILKGDWGTAKPSSGQVAAGAANTVSIEPRDLCPLLKGQTSFTLDLNAGSAGRTVVTYTATP